MIPVRLRFFLIKNNISTITQRWNDNNNTFNVKNTFIHYTLSYNILKHDVYVSYKHDVRLSILMAE